MNATQRRMATLFQIIFWGVAFVLISGCTNIRSYYPIVPNASLPDVSRQNISNKPSITLQWDFQRNGESLQAVKDMWSNHVKEVIAKTNTFSKVETSGAPTDYTLKVIMNNVHDSTAGALAKSVASGLTLGLIGVKVTDNYLCSATLTQKSGKEVAKDYKYAITSTFGLIVSGVEGVPPKEKIEDAFSDILDHFLLKCVSDFQRDGNLM
jgi:hypothetical protein